MSEIKLDDLRWCLMHHLRSIADMLEIDYKKYRRKADLIIAITNVMCGLTEEGDLK